MNIVVILTTTVKIQKHITWLEQRCSNVRYKMYEKIISLWLNKTNLNIVVIENSGHKFKVPDKFKNRFEMISFSYSKIPEKDRINLNKMKAKGQHEVYAIQYACNHSKIIKNSDFVIKITGRYFIPSLENILIKNLKSDIDAIQQSVLWRKMNRCEVVGCSSKNIFKLFYFPAKNDMLEQEYMNRIKHLGKILKLPKMKLHKKTKQGCGGKARDFL